MEAMSAGNSARVLARLLQVRQASMTKIEEAARR